MKSITKIEGTKEIGSKKKLRVAAYARVSTGYDDQLVSLETQKNHYKGYILTRPDWEYAGLYYDEGVSGTSVSKREGLQRLLADCDRGLIDYIIVKSISRFLVTLWKALKWCGVSARKASTSILKKKTSIPWMPKGKCL